MDQPTTETKKSRSNTGLLLLVVLLLISNVVMLWMLMQRGKEVEQGQQQVQDLTTRNEDVLGMLESTLDSYDSLQTQNDTMRVEMEYQKQQIEELIAKVKSGSYSLAKAKKEAETLRAIMKGYVATIDSLNTANQALTAQNQGLTQELGETKAQREALATEKEALQGKIAKGAILHTTTISAGALFMRSNGKQVDTDRAKKAELVKCCFTLGENKVTDAGDKTIYMRVISPDGTVLPAGEGGGRFQFNGVEGEYSAKREVNYQNAPVDACIFWTGTSEMATGQYIVEIYEGGALVSKASFDLK
jgi:FtsZ-binding cell division protein ZapB